MRLWLAAALGLVGIALWLLLAADDALPERARQPLPAPVPVTPPVTLAAAGVAAPQPVPPLPALPPPSHDLADHAHRFPAGELPRMAEVIAELQRRGVREGIAAFNPPGTKPHLIGLAVPPDFELPPGYVRHHQTTDDGQPIEPVLRFHPDHRLFDAAGRPVPLPADLLVPPEWAPPGLPLRRVVIPPPL